MQRSHGVLALALMLAGSSTRADSLHPAIAVAGTTPCAGAEPLSSAVSRDAGIPAFPARDTPAPAPGLVVVELSDTGAGVVVEITAGSFSTRALVRAPCAAVADAVAAEVAAALWRVPVDRPETAAAPALAPAPAADEPTGCGPTPPGGPCERVELLAEVLAEFSQVGAPEILAANNILYGVGIGGIHLGMRSGAWAAHDWLLAGSAAILTGGGVATLAHRDHDHAQTIALVSGLAGAGTFALGLAFRGEVRDGAGDIVLPDQRHDALLIAGLALYAQAAMVLFDDLDQPPVSRRRLADDHRRIATSARRTTIGAEEIRAMEARLAATRARRSIWLRTAPTWAGTAAVLLRGATEEHPGEREFAVYAAGLLALGGLVAILGDTLHPFERYQRRLERLDLRLEVGPSGLGVRGAW